MFADASTVGTYKCIATNDAGSATSDDMVLTTITNPYTYNLFDMPLDGDRVIS
jgi:hypothetical protein